MNIGFYNYDNATPAILNWASSFGLKDSEIKQSPVSVLMQVSIPQKEKKEVVMEQVNENINKVLAFKQVQLDAKKRLIREQQLIEAEAPEVFE